MASRLIGSIERHEAVGTQNYHALRLSTQRRAASGVGLSANYTRSYCVGNDPQTTFFTGGQGFQNPDDPDLDRGNCTYERRHNASLSAVFETPEFANRALRAVASSWNVAGIFSARSGGWLTVTTARDVDGHGHHRAAGQSGAGRPVRQRDARQLPQPGRIRVSGDRVRSAATFAHSIEGPAYWSIDLALARRISFGAAREIELRLETFNLLNHFNWGNPTLNFDAANFGRIRTQSGSPRILQFGSEVRFLTET